MTRPLRIDCPSVADIPPPGRLRELVTDERHVVLQFPSEALAELKKQLVAQLAAALPDYSVFDSGGSSGQEWVTVMRVIPTAVVLTHAGEFLAAMRLFRRTAADLANRLAAKLGVPPEHLLDRVVRDDEAVGPMDEVWSSRPHGMECRFENGNTGQVVEAEIGFGAEFGVLNPYFFARFVKTTPGLEGLARLLRDDFHDAARVFEILQARGHLRTVENEFGPGRVVRDQDDAAGTANTPAPLVS